MFEQRRESRLKAELKTYANLQINENYVQKNTCRRISSTRFPNSFGAKSEANADYSAAKFGRKNSK
jgi:hypothetical protein